MEHKPDILLVGLHNQSDLESFNEISLFRCRLKQQAIEIVIERDIELVVSKFSLEDGNAVELNHSLLSLKNNYPDSIAKNTKLLVLTSNSAEEDLCKNHQILYYPGHRNLKSLIIKLIALPREPAQNRKKPVIIDFKELFIRVDDNREFIQTIIEKFFDIRKSRLQDIKVPLLKNEFQNAKDAVHKLKGVLANFSMQEARTTTIELEALLLKKDKVASIQKLENLTAQIEKAKEFYEQNLDQFNDQK